MPGLDPAAETTGRSHSTPDDAGEELGQLRSLLVGPEQEQLRELEDRLNDPGLRANEISQILAQSVRICAARDNTMARALGPVVESVLKNLVRQEPAIITDLIYPVLGRSIRKAVRAALQGMTQSLNRAVEQSLTLRGIGWRIEAWRTGKPYGEIVLLRSLLYRVEQVFLIHKKTGLLLQQVAVADVVRDPDLVSAMLTAIQDFMSDSFAEGGKGELETIQVGDLGVWIQDGPLASLAGVVRGVAPRELSAVFQETLERIHQEQASELESFTGETAAFEAVKPQLQACLLGNAAPRSRRLSLPALALVCIAGTAVVAGLVQLAVSALEERRWNRSLERLQAEPGIVVTNVEKRDGRYFLHGLRDPLSRDPSEILEDAGVDARRVTWQGELFTSAHPRFAAIRAYEKLRAEMERRVIHFNLGSALVAPGQLDGVNDLAAAARSLFSAAETAGRAVRLEVVGHADALGTRPANERLCQDRASNVVRLLVAGGIAPDRLLARPAGPTDAAATRAAEGAEMKRRVSFRVAPVSR